MTKNTTDSMSAYRPYIEYIRFPKFKNLDQDTKITFDYPITVLVGENGVNKSSVLRALYGCPHGYSIGYYWFETDIDKIDESQGQSCFIYGYYNKGAQRVVEVIKSRVTKKETDKNGKIREDPDYWEPTRPNSSYNMEQLTNWKSLSKKEQKKLIHYRYQTRWHLLRKHVTYFDFRREALSAFDKAFYCYALPKRKTIQTKQDLIRFYSSKLKHVIDTKQKSYKLYNKEKIKSIEQLKEKEIDKINKILNKHYSEITIIDHSFYSSSPARTIVVTETTGNGSTKNYSEAFAGSGEFAVITLVHFISVAEHHELILLDEPEVSIHPEAQKLVLSFLKESAESKKLQIVIATHSPYLVQDLPKEAIKILYTNSQGKVEVRNSSYPIEAFYRIGALNRKIKVVVEDRCAEAVLKNAFIRQEIENLFEFIVPPFGAEGILTKDTVTSYFCHDTDIIFCLDGDQRFIIPDPDDIPESDNENLLEIITKLTGIQKIPYKDNKLETKYKNERGYLKFIKTHLFFLPLNDPEEIIWEVMDDSDKDIINRDFSDHKEAFRKLTLAHFGCDDSNSIAEYERYHAAKIKTSSHPVVSELDNLVLSIKEAINI